MTIVSSHWLIQRPIEEFDVKRKKSMSKTSSIDVPPLDMTTNTPRSKKIAPPPLRLPETVTNHQNEDKNNSIEQQKQEKFIENHSCSALSTDDCPHKPIPLVLPVNQRAQILEFLTKTSSTLLVPPQFESKQRRTSNQTNFLRDRQTVSKTPIPDAEWIDLLHAVIRKSLNNDVKNLIDKYKSTFFDRVNSANTSDETIRSSLCAMISETLSTFSNPSTTNENKTSPTNGKRKRDVSTNSFNNQTKFLVSYLTPGRIDGNKTIGSKQKKLQKNFSTLFKYVPDKDEQNLLIRSGHLKTNSNSENICLMLYDEILHQTDEQDRELCGISLDDAFVLPESILMRISSIN